MKNILITPSEEGGRVSLHGDYAAAVMKSGGLPIILPLTADEGMLNGYLEMADGLLLSGGGDVSPTLYGEERHPLCGEANILRDEMEIYLCRKALERHLPVLGICRGVQVMNVALGGTLHQHMEGHSRSDLPRDAVHDVTIMENTRLFDIFGQKVLGVNSRHHQAVKALGEGLICAATGPEGIPEGVELPGEDFFLGVQWHPESMYEAYPEMRKIFAAFLAAVKGKA